MSRLAVVVLLALTAAAFDAVPFLDHGRSASPSEKPAGWAWSG